MMKMRGRNAGVLGIKILKFHFAGKGKYKVLNVKKECPGKYQLVVSEKSWKKLQQKLKEPVAS
jgi:hypothetical protein